MGLESDMDRILSAVPHLQQGPGGSVAVVRDGEVIGQRSWGYASLDQRIAMTPDTIMPICSISKQMVCLAMVSICRDPTPAMLMKKDDPWQQLTKELHSMLPQLVGSADGELTVQHLAHMQSGIRDYWAMTTLFGARPEDAFSIQVHAPQALARTKSFHFPPGTEYSYSNVNFHVLGRLIERVSGQSLGQTLAERVFIPAGMSTATLYINTNGLPLPIVGYEGNEKVGWFAATNRIEWAGDAGIAASLNDMIAYEKYLDRSWSDSSSLYHFTSQQQHYKDGTPAHYGYGLGRGETCGKSFIGHGGALRGFRLSRQHIPSDRLSIVVMLNFEADPSAPAVHILKQMTNYKDPEPASLTSAPEWEGNFLDESTSLYLNVSRVQDKPGQLGILYGPGRIPDVLKLTTETTAESDDMKASIDRDTLNVDVLSDHKIIRARRIQKPSDDELFNARSSEYTGIYRCNEADSTFHCSGEDGTLYGSFDGFLGQGPVWLMQYLGEDIWRLSTQRGMDATPPGDWTVHLQSQREQDSRECHYRMLASQEESFCKNYIDRVSATF